MVKNDIIILVVAYFFRPDGVVGCNQLAQADSSDSLSFLDDCVERFHHCKILIPIALYVYNCVRLVVCSAHAAVEPSGGNHSSLGSSAGSVE